MKSNSNPGEYMLVLVLSMLFTFIVGIAIGLVL